MTDRYKQVMRFASQTPWAIQPEKLAVIADLLALRASGEKLAPEEIQARIGSGPSAKRTETQGAVAVIPIYGVITPKADLFSQISGGTSMQGLMESLRTAAADDSVGAILLDIDSPGGSVDLVPEAAAAIRDARAQKPVVAIASTLAASAAYWLGSQADELVVTPSGIVGSIGVFSIHQDFSEYLADEGIATTLIKAGKFKAEGNPYEPLSEEALAAIQDHIDTFYDMFTGDVASGRGTTKAAVQSGFGEGRIVTAGDALDEGMVDRVDTFEATLERVLVRAATGSSARAIALGDQQSAIAIARANTAGVTWTGAPPGGTTKFTIPTLEAADSGLSFARSVLAVRDQIDRLTATAQALCAQEGGRGLTAAKRDALSALEASASELAGVIASADSEDLTNEVLAELIGYREGA